MQKRAQLVAPGCSKPPLQPLFLLEKVRFIRLQIFVTQTHHGVQNRDTLTGGRNSQRALQKGNLPRDLREWAPIETAWVKGQVEVANMTPTRLSRPSGTSKTSRERVRLTTTK